MAIKVSKEEAEEILAEERHRQSKESFRVLSEALKSNNKEVISAIGKQTISINELIKSILNQPLPQASTVELNQVEVVSVLKELILKIDQVKEIQEEIRTELKIMNQPKESICSFKRDGYSGVMESPVVIRTNYIKPKAQA